MAIMNSYKKDDIRPVQEAELRVYANKSNDDKHYMHLRVGDYGIVLSSEETKELINQLSNPFYDADSAESLVEIPKPIKEKK